MNNSFVEAYLAEVVDAASRDKELAQKLMSNPAELFRSAGINVPSDYREKFNTLMDGILQPLVIGRLGGKQFSALTGFSCASCKIGAFGIAVTIVGIGAVALTSFTATTPIVIALASYAGVNATTALAFLVGAGSHVAAGVSSLVAEICEWIGVCP